MIPMNDLTRGISKSEEAINAVARVVRSGHWVHGPEHNAFESEAAKFLNVNHFLGVASGTDALEIALRAVECVRGSKIITVANAGGYTPIAAAAIGCEIIFCDVDEKTLLMDPKSLEQLLSYEVKAVVVTHLYGNVAEVSAIMQMCEPYGIKIIEDCAQSFGAFENEKATGTFGHVGTFSFYPTKNLGGIGDGGALATNDSEIAKRITALRQYGWTSKYKIDLPGGMNSRLDEIQAAVLRIGLPKLKLLNQRRIEIIEQYAEALKGSDIKLVTSSDAGGVAHLAVLQVPETLGRDTFRSYMSGLGIQTDVHYPILDFDQSGLTNPTSPDSLKSSRSSSGRIVSIPLFPELLDSEVQAICNALTNFASSS